MISIEVFAAKAKDGSTAGVMLAVPLRCGLKDAQSLRLQGSELAALRGRAVMPLALPELDAASARTLRDVAQMQEEIAVAEFNAVGLVDAYMLKLVVID